MGQLPYNNIVGLTFFLFSISLWKLSLCRLRVKSRVISASCQPTGTHSMNWRLSEVKDHISTLAISEGQDVTGSTMWSRAHTCSWVVSQTVSLPPCIYYNYGIVPSLLLTLPLFRECTTCLTNCLVGLVLVVKLSTVFDTNFYYSFYSVFFIWLVKSPICCD